MPGYTVVLRHSMYGDTPLSGEFTDKTAAGLFRRGAEMMYDLIGQNVGYEKVVVIETEDE